MDMLQTARDTPRQKSPWVRPAPDVPQKAPGPALLPVRRKKDSKAAAKEPTLDELEVPQGPEYLERLIEEKFSRAEILDHAASDIEHCARNRDARKEYISDEQVKNGNNWLIGALGVGMVMALTLGVATGAALHSMEAALQAGAICLAVSVGVGSLMGLMFYVGKRADAAFKTVSHYVSEVVLSAHRSGLGEKQQEDLLLESAASLAAQRDEVLKEIDSLSERLEKEFGEEIHERDDAAFQATLRKLRKPVDKP